MTDRHLNELREARDRLVDLLLSYEKENGENFPEERNIALRRNIAVVERRIADLEQDDA